jgi:lysozyme
MPTLNRGKAKLPHPGPYLGIVTNHLDVTQMGMIEVSIINGLPDDGSLQSRTYPVNYLSPFYGITSVKYEGNDSTSFGDVQKSYGMWMVPPDLGTQVLVIFINGDPNQGYWIGCVMDTYQNHMVPGIAANKNSALTSDQLKKYQTSLLPVAEIHKSSNKGASGPSVDKLPRAVHPFADRLLAQGLLLDTVRGVTSSSARREIPSMVFGISTPGPLDTNGPKKPIGYGAGKIAPVSRLGGSTFVMDDGDIDGQNELVRIRTRTGHQILLHNTKDLIYIGNAQGTAWIELTSNGKIDIYSADSISVHTEQDLNFRADRNVNIEAGGKINMSANADVHIESNVNLNLLSQRNTIIQSGNQLTVTAEANIDIKSDYTISLESQSDFNIKSNALLKIGSKGNLHISSDADTLQNSTNFHIKSSQDGFITTGGQIHIDGAPASTAEKSDSASPITVSELQKFSLPNRSVSGSWENDFYKVENLMTIMTRVPTHEPYDQHESINPDQFSYTNLDSSNPQVIGRLSEETAKNIKETFKLPPNIPGVPPTPTGNLEQDNLQAFLWMIRVAEGTSKSTGYQSQWPSREFDISNPKRSDGTINPAYQFKDHPKEVRTANGIPSSAAGAYQFLYKTWVNCKTVLGLPDFGPQSQDRAAIYLLSLNNSIEDIKKGNFAEALYKNRKTWASLPGANYPGQGMRSYDLLVNVYKKAGGKLA